MKIQTLESTSIEDIHGAWEAAFADYQVKMDLSVDDLRRIFQRNSVDLRLSAGLFDGDRLVGFWINGIRDGENGLMAYDSGTGITKEYRGKGLSKDLSKSIMGILKKHGVKTYILEVITTNTSAYQLYLSQGFKVKRRLLCFRTRRENMRTPDPDVLSRVSMGSFDELSSSQLPPQEFQPSWQDSHASIQNIRESVNCAWAAVNGSTAAYAITVREKGGIIQFGTLPNACSEELLRAVLWKACEGGDGEYIKKLNTDNRDQQSISSLRKMGFSEFIQQYEMEKNL